MPDPTDTLVQQLAQALIQRGWLMATAESCTGGLIAARCTELAGSSAWFDRGVVSYSNEAKIELLSVPADLIAQHGAVSEAVARAMAEGMLRRSKAHIAVAVTGIAGPGGGTLDKPVGTVWLAWAQPSATEAPALHTQARCMHFEGDRAQVRHATCELALAEIVRLLQLAHS